MTSTEPRLTEQQRTTMSIAHEDAAAVTHLATFTEQQLDEAEAERTRRMSLEDGFQVLRWLITAPRSERVTEVDTVLHTEKGDLDPDQINDYIGHLLRGATSLQARHAMVKDRRHPDIERVRLVGTRLRGFADSQWGQARQASPARTAAALPPAVPSTAPATAEPLPQRLVPAAPAESPSETTGQMIDRHRGLGVAVTAEQEAAMRKDHRTGPDMGPAADPRFAASAIPAARGMGDTMPMRADEVLAELAADDAQQDGPEADGDAPAPRPFPGADTAQQPNGVSGRGDGDDD
jgi:hypothetical protein